MRFSKFNVYTRRKEDSTLVLIKNTKTGGVVAMQEAVISALKNGDRTLSETEAETLYQSGIIVDESKDEFADWNSLLMDARNKKAEQFILHVIPTVNCQLRCGYCFENGADRGTPMKPEVEQAGIEWVTAYLKKFPQIKQFRLVFFGGEPLLRKDIVLRSCEVYARLCESLGLEFWTELVTNGELLDLEFAQKLSQYNWKRVQITLDGTRNVHNKRRPGTNDRDIFGTVTGNIQNLLGTSHIDGVDVRVSFDLSNADSAIELLDQLVTFGDTSRIRLTLGFITDTFEGVNGDKSEGELAEKALAFWAKTKALGFKIPEDQIAGPLCVAVAKHSAVFTPDGGIQKCFATVGRPEFNFATVFVKPAIYAKDERYERWKRTDDCIKEECAFLPICGGGCPHDAMVAAGNQGGSANRFCQKGFLKSMNEGLLQLNY